MAVGGGVNHRVGLFDGILLKDNHIAAAGGVAQAVKAALANAPAGLRVQVEVQSEVEVDEALAAGADFLLLDNCSPTLVQRIAQRGRFVARELFNVDRAVNRYLTVFANITAE